MIVSITGLRKREVINDVLTVILFSFLIAVYKWVVLVPYLQINSTRIIPYLE